MYSPNVVHLAHALVQGAHRPALSHHLERHALTDVALTAPVDEERLVRPAEDVHETGRHGKARCIDLQGSREGSGSGNGRDRVVVHRDVGGDRRTAESIVDEASANDHFMGLGGRIAGGDPRNDREQA